MTAHSEVNASDPIASQISIWISGLTFAVVLLLGSVIIDIKTDLGVIQYQLKDLAEIKKTIRSLEDNQRQLLSAIASLRNDPKDTDEHKND